MESCSPGESRMKVVAWSQLVIAVPLIDTKRSPGLMPAAAAGAFSSVGAHSVCVLDAGSTQAETLAIVGLGWAIPKTQSTMA